MAMTMGETRRIIQVGLLQQKPRCYKSLAPQAVIISSKSNIAHVWHNAIMRRGPSILWQSELFAIGHPFFAPFFPFFPWWLGIFVHEPSYRACSRTYLILTTLPQPPNYWMFSLWCTSFNPPQYYYNSGCPSRTRLIHCRSLETIQCIRFTTSYRHMRPEHLSPNFVWTVRYA